MAYILRVRGDLDGAMRLYQEALEIAERLGDLQGKSATLHEMAYILRVRGDLDGAMRLYQQSLEIKERLGDLRGTATLAMMAQVLVMDGAMRLYQEALEIFERLGDLRDKAVTLGMMGQALCCAGEARGGHRLPCWSGLELLIPNRLGIEPQTQQAMASTLAAGVGKWAPRPSTACGARSSGRSRRPGWSPRPLERLSAIP
jgi:tetratricopeptide (TPR) repeat protein